MTVINMATRVPSFKLTAFSSIPQAFERIISSVFGRVHCSCEKSPGFERIRKKRKVFQLSQKSSFTSHHIHLHHFAYLMRPLDKGYRVMLLLFLCLCLIVATVYLIPVSSWTGRNGVRVKAQTFFYLKLVYYRCLACGVYGGDMVESCVLIIEGAHIAWEKDYFAIEHEFTFNPRSCGDVNIFVL